MPHDVECAAEPTAGGNHTMVGETGGGSTLHEIAHRTRCPGTTREPCDLTVGGHSSDGDASNDRVHAPGKRGLRASLRHPLRSTRARYLASPNPRNVERG